MSKKIKQSKWVKIDIDEDIFKTESSNLKNESGQQVTGLSPLDVPTKVRSVHDMLNHTLAIEFEYIWKTEESHIKKEVKGPVTLLVGEVSGKLYAFSIDLTQLDFPSPENFSRCIQSVGTVEDQAKPALHFDLAASMAENKSENLLAVMN